MPDRDFMAMVMSAENRWLQGFVAGPTIEGRPLRRGDAAPDVPLLGRDGSEVRLASTWASRPALILLWRHLGCGCGRERARRLIDEIAGYREAGLEVVVVAPGEPERVDAYATRNGLEVLTLADPEYSAHRAFGLGHWSVEQVMYDAPAEYCDLSLESGKAMLEDRRSKGTNLVDDPWMQSGEFVVDKGGVVRVAYLYNYCEDYPNPAVFTTAGRLASME
jgi:peroxiredoxin